MTRRPFHRGDLRWLFLLIGALVLPWVLPNLQPRVPSDSYQTGPLGKKALYRISERIGWFEVSRNLDSLGILLDSHAGYESEVMLLFLGPARAPTEREWERLLEFVSDGGAFVYAVPRDATKFDAPPFGVSAAELDDPIRLADEEDASLETDLGELDGSFSWRSTWEWESSAGAPLVTIDDSVQALLVERGQGAAVFVATAAPFENYTLTWPDNTVLAMRLIERAGPRPVLIFDERLNASGIPKVVAILLDPPLRAMSLHLLAGLCVFGWWGSRRFGPVLPPHEGKRSDIVAHADAVGMLHYKSRNSAAVLKLYLRQLQAALKLRKLNGTRERRILEPIARRRGHTVEDVKAVFRQAIAAAKQEDLDRATSAKLIRRLAKIRRAAKRSIS